MFDKFRERRRMKKEAREATKDADLERKLNDERETKLSTHGRWPFYDYPIDKFYTRKLFDLLIVDKEHAMVKLNLGRIGKIKRIDEDGYIIPAEGKLQPGQRELRDWPYGGVFGPGFHFAFTPLGLSRIAVVYTGQRLETIRSFGDNDVITADGVSLENVESLVSYRVVDPLAAMTNAPPSKIFKEVVREYAKTRLTDRIGDIGIFDLLDLRDEENNFTYTGAVPKGLENVGIVIDGIHLSKMEVPEAFRDALQAKAKARAEYDATVIRSKGNLYEARVNDRIGRILNENPGALEFTYLQAASKESGRVNYDVHGGKTAGAIGDFAKAIKEIFTKDAA